MNEPDLLLLALRLATYPNDSRTQNAQILPGQLPDQLPLEIPLPEVSRVLGSLIRNPEDIDILLDTFLPPEQVLAFYRQSMETLGWQTTDIYRPNRGGFMPSGSRNRGGNETFYLGLRDPSLTIKDLESSAPWHDDDNRNRSGPVLTVNAYPDKGNMTDLRLNLNMNGPFPPGPLPHMRGRPSRNTIILLPTVEAPEGANLRFHGGGQSGNSAHSDAILETNSDLSTLAAHYKTQLEQSGCVLIEQGQDGPLAWITWTLKDDDKQCHGFFMILKEIGQEYYLNMRMKSENGGTATTEK